VKFRQAFLIILLILIADQALKIYIKTHFYIGQDHKVLGLNWFRLHFVENPGMAWGLKFGGDWGKMILTLFRLVAVIFGVFYIRRVIKQQYHRGFIICACLIFAGALGNLIDSMFYGMLFSESPEYTATVAQFMPKTGGYAGFLHGKVVDMFYFPMHEGKLPSWFPFWKDDPNYVFFSPVFNIADASISIGVITILLFQKRFFRKKTEETFSTVETNAAVNDPTQVY
jgi:signal peptidase II